MEVDIVMDRRISYQLFLTRCFSSIISTRLNPFSQDAVQKHLTTLIQKIKRRKQSYEPLLLEVYIRSLNNKEIEKIEQWTFAPISIIQESVKSKQSQTSVKNKNVFQCRFPSKIYKQLEKYNIQFNLVLQTQLVTPLEGQNVFEAPLQYFQFQDFNCTISMVYTYQFEEEEEQFHILSPISPSSKQISFRKYSQGLQPIQVFITKTQHISKNKLNQLKQKSNKLNFSLYNTQTIKNTLDFLGLQ